MSASTRALSLASGAALAAYEVKAEEVIALDVTAHLPLADIFLIASGSNEPQNRKGT